jgi:hypothetical protein
MNLAKSFFFLLVISLLAFVTVILIDQKIYGSIQLFFINEKIKDMYMLEVRRFNFGPDYTATPHAQSLRAAAH